MNKTDSAINILKNGGIVIFPTDTAFGIGCSIDNEKAVEKLFRIRKRPTTQATPVLVDSIEMAKKYLEKVPGDVLELMNKYWPGALTIVLQSRMDKVPKLVRGGGSTIGVRIPDNSTIRKIIKGLGVPILGPSANFHGEKTPYEFEDLDPELIKLADFVVKGKTSAGDVSTVIDASKKPWKVLRQGAVKVQNDILLTIDTTSSEEIEVGLKIDDKKFTEKKKMNSKKREIVLSLIQNILKKNKLKLGDLTEIEVNPGPGSFTGIRIGISIANALGFALNIPVNGKIGGELNPVYNK